MAAHVVNLGQQKTGSWVWWALTNTRVWLIPTDPDLVDGGRLDLQFAGMQCTFADMSTQHYSFGGFNSWDYWLQVSKLNLAPGQGVDCTADATGVGGSYGMATKQVSYLPPGQLQYQSHSAQYGNGDDKSTVATVLTVPRSPHLTVSLDTSACRAASTSGACR